MFILYRLIQNRHKERVLRIISRITPLAFFFFVRYRIYHVFTLYKRNILFTRVKTNSSNNNFSFENKIDTIMGDKQICNFKYFNILLVSPLTFFLCFRVPSIFFLMLYI